MADGAEGEGTEQGGEKVCSAGEKGLGISLGGPDGGFRVR